MGDTISLVDRIPDHDAIAAILRQYYLAVLPKLAALNGPDMDLDDLVKSAIDDMPDFAPPSGRIALAHSEDGRLVGTGVMRTCAPGAVEVKRLFVLPECQGQGLAARLVDAQLDAARAMGMTDAYVDVLGNNTEALRFFEKLGFVPCEQYDGLDEYDALTDFMVYRRLTL